ncbi:F-box protein FBW2-like isoform X1 [Zingiber officinale]|nr:F-box protein FBW2-like isoform X1 [Zingiber officinale]
MFFFLPCNIEVTLPTFGIASFLHFLCVLGFSECRLIPLGGGDDMAEGSDARAWEELIPDALGLIFRNLPLQEILTVIPRVCKSWSRVVLGPYCWQEIDIDEWSQHCKPEQLDKMLHMLIDRSCGSFRRLSVSGLHTESMFTLIADHAGSLQRLELPRSEMNDAIVKLVAPRLCNLTYLDVSYCSKIGACAIEAFGKHCRSLVVLRRTMHPLEVDRNYQCQEEEAYAIAKTMTKLRHLEMSYQPLTTQAVLEILSKCKDLEYLDLRGCWDVKLDEKYLKERHSGLKVLGPDIVDHYEQIFWNDWADSYSDSSGYEEAFDDDVIWEDENGIELDGFQVRFYGGGFSGVVTGFDWPPSP